MGQRSETTSVSTNKNLINYLTGNVGARTPDSGEKSQLYMLTGNNVHLVPSESKVGRRASSI